MQMGTRLLGCYCIEEFPPPVRQEHWHELGPYHYPIFLVHLNVLIEFFQLLLCIYQIP